MSQADKSSWQDDYLQAEWVCNVASLIVVLGTSISGQVEAHALWKATTAGCTTAALCSASAMRTSLVEVFVSLRQHASKHLCVCGCS